jgi:hypothetical protein
MFDAQLFNRGKIDAYTANVAHVGSRLLAGPHWKGE